MVPLGARCHLCHGVLGALWCMFAPSKQQRGTLLKQHMQLFLMHDLLWCSGLKKWCCACGLADVAVLQHACNGDQGLSHAVCTMLGCAGHSGPVCRAYSLTTFLQRNSNAQVEKCVHVGPWRVWPNYVVCEVTCRKTGWFDVNNVVVPTHCRKALFLHDGDACTPEFAAQGINAVLLARQQCHLINKPDVGGLAAISRSARVFVSSFSLQLQAVAAFHLV